MPSAIILVNTTLGLERQVLKGLRTNTDVEEVFAVHGPYDIVVRVKADTFAKLRESIAHVKRSLPKMQQMVTMLLVEGAAPLKRMEKPKL